VARVFVTGGAGFIGTALMRRLLQERKKGALEVRAFDLEPTPLEECEAVRGSILDAPALARAMRGCEWVVHLAAFLGVQRSDQDPLRCLDVNVAGTKNVLEACAANAVRKVVFTSSSEVYGENGRVPASEGSTLRPGSVYAVSKLTGEEYLRAYATRYGFDYTILRPFNVYGPGQSEEFVIPRFVRAAIESRPPQVYGTGQQVRTFCCVDDIVEGLTLALFSPEAAGQVFNLGNDTGHISILELGRKIVALSNCRGPAPRLVPYEQADRPPERDVTWRVPLIQKARAVLAYAPKITLDEGLLRCVDSMKHSAGRPGISPPRDGALRAE
jgi:UDP-glucose 4-epimerase